MRLSISPFDLASLQGIEAEAQRQMPVVDATVDRVGEARAGVRNTAKQTFNYRTGR